MRLAVSKLAYEQLDNFLTVSGLAIGKVANHQFLYRFDSRNSQEVEILTAILHQRVYQSTWSIPAQHVRGQRRTQGPPIQKYKALLETKNAPFRSGYTSTKASKRLWNYLVRQKSVQDIFIRYIFVKSRSVKLAREFATAICVTRCRALLWATNWIVITRSCSRVERRLWVVPTLKPLLALRLANQFPNRCVSCTRTKTKSAHFAWTTPTRAWLLSQHKKRSRNSTSNRSWIRVCLGWKRIPKWTYSTWDKSEYLLV